MLERVLPKNVGILGIDIYFPQRYVNQSELEQFDKVPSGKYTIGLGQENMAFVGDREDIVSMCMSSVHTLMSKYSISYDQIGRLEVGTETLIDKSKSIKSCLMTMFQEHGNTSIEGVDTINACYGGTNALFNSVQWVESSYWDGRRLALVVTGDIAVYSKGPARPTGGAGVITMLIGPNASIVMEPSLRGVHMENVYDFYKPHMDSEYPMVDGKLSIDCFIRALDISYHQYRKQFQNRHNQNFTIDEHADFVIFHTPYNRLVQKAFARLIYNDFLHSSKSRQKYQKYLQKFESLALSKESFGNVELDKASLEASKEEYKVKVLPSTLLSKQLGNSYCASTYASLLSLISTKASQLQGKRILVFSYGSGLASSFFSFSVDNNNNPKFSSESIRSLSSIPIRLQARIKSTPQKFISALELRENLSKRKELSYQPVDSIDHLLPGTFYLESIDKNAIRYYKLKEDLFTSKL